VLQVNYEFFDNQTVSSAEALVDALQAGREAGPHPRAPR
jgi:NADH-quinone oxidoreductase subunit E